MNNVEPKFCRPKIQTQITKIKRPDYKPNNPNSGFRKGDTLTKAVGTAGDLHLHATPVLRAFTFAPCSRFTHVSIPAKEWEAVTESASYFCFFLFDYKSRNKIIVMGGRFFFNEYTSKGNTHENRRKNTNTNQILKVFSVFLFDCFVLLILFYSF
ncbi:hypothetical protein V6Z11_A05G396100 [Gossypium hirsutum]